jgi:2,3-bisphosphoglycerate-dependent phosphoglycerate mutase
VGVTSPPSHAQNRYAIPDGATTFVLVRHGSSEAYVEGQSFPLADGHGDPALSELGEEQAELLVPRLLQEDFDAIYVTSLKRTHQTVAPYLAKTGRTAETIFELREVFMGDWEGGEFRAHFAAGDPRALAVFEDGEWGAIPGAETTQQLQDRCVSALLKLHGQHQNQRVMCVVHGGVIDVICQWATGARQAYHWGAENASVHVVVVNGDYRRLHLFNDTTHLDI